MIFLHKYHMINTNNLNPFEKTRVECVKINELFSLFSVSKERQHLNGNVVLLCRQLHLHCDIPMLCPSQEKLESSDRLGNVFHRLPWRVRTDIDKHVRAIDIFVPCFARSSASFWFLLFLKWCTRDKDRGRLGESAAIT